MTTGYNLTKEIQKERKRPKKSSTNASVARDAFGEEVRKVLPIPGVIDGYNTSMNMVDQANQLRSYFTTLPNRTEKEFFPGVFWSLDFILVNCYKIFIIIYPEYLTYTTGNRDTTVHRRFIEDFINEIWQYTNETFETIPEESLKKVELIPRERGRPSLSKSLSKSQETSISIPLDTH